MDDFTYNNYTSDRCHTYCKDCVNKYYRGNKIKLNSAYKARYNITLKQKQERIERQNGCCYLCETTLPSNPRDQCVEHDPITGQIFGIACRKCNLGISHFNHDPNLMIKIALRMKQFRQKIPNGKEVGHGSDKSSMAVLT